jgi:hypothetical protein
MVTNSSQQPGSSPVASAADQVQQVAGQALDQAKQQATTQFSQGKAQAADQVGSVPQALRQTGEQLRKQEQTPVAEVVDGAAAQLERFSSYLRDATLDEIRWDVERFARSQPAAFLGGAFTLGVLAARFLKSTGNRYEGSSQAVVPRQTGAIVPTYAPQVPPSPAMATGATGTGIGYRVPPATTGYPAPASSAASSPDLTTTTPTSAIPTIGAASGAGTPRDAWARRVGTADPDAPEKEGT